MYKESTTQNEVKKIVMRASKEHLEINFTGKKKYKTFTKTIKQCRGS